jgi:hypothetical protein
VNYRANIFSRVLFKGKASTVKAFSVPVMMLIENLKMRVQFLAVLLLQVNPHFTVQPATSFSSCVDWIKRYEPYILNVCLFVLRI